MIDSESLHSDSSAVFRVSVPQESPGIADIGNPQKSLRTAWVIRFLESYRMGQNTTYCSTPRAHKVHSGQLLIRHPIGFLECLSRDAVNHTRHQWRLRHRIAAMSRCGWIFGIWHPPWNLVCVSLIAFSRNLELRAPFLFHSSLQRKFGNRARQRLVRFWAFCRGRHRVALSSSPGNLMLQMNV